MASVVKVAFKEVTDAEFLAINIKEKGSTSKGGGQSYIDFQASEISESEWDSFFAGASVPRTSPEGWIFDVRSLGTSKPPQTGIELSYRDAPKLTRFGLREQKHPDISKRGNRLYAWRSEETGFPALPAGVVTKGNLPPGLIDELRVLLIKDDENRIWATWLKGPPPQQVFPPLDQIFAKRAGIVDVSRAFELDVTNPQWPFVSTAESEGPSWDDSDELDVPEQGITYSVQKVRQRDKAAADAVRKLYKKCQISGDEFLFLTKKGKPYLEVHHLIPLGKGGADSPHNMIVVSPQIHRMLHYADVSAIDLSQIANNALQITINGKPYTITWHSQHAAQVLAHNQP